MAESKTRKPVKLIRGGRESRAIVEHPHEKPWSVVEHVSKDERAASVEFQWEVMIFLPSTIPLVFESREEARAWTAQDERAREYKWDVLKDPRGGAGIERSKAATERFYEFAKKKGLRPDSPEAFKLAHEEEVVRSVCLYSELGCQGLCQVVEDYLEDWSKLGLNWTPQSCKCYSQGTLYANASGMTLGGNSAPVCGPGCVDELPFDVQAVKSE